MGRAGQQLQYAAERLPWYRWKRVQRGTVWGAICIAVGVFALVWGPRCWRWAKVAYWRQQCLAYMAPGDQVVLELDGDKAGKLLQSGQGYAAWSGLPGKPAAMLAVRPFDEYWSEYYPPSSWSPPALAVLFLHGRQVRGGKEKLVMVVAGPVTVGRPNIGFVLGIVADPHPKTGPSARLGGPMPAAGMRAVAFNSRFDKAAAARNLRFFAGQPDPHDKSHFTIKYEIGNQAGTIDGYLQSSDDEVLLEVRDGPATMPAVAGQTRLAHLKR